MILVQTRRKRPAALDAGAITQMHAEERERLILDAMSSSGFISYRALQAQLTASPATIRRDLARLEDEGRIARVRGGARLTGENVVSGAAPHHNRLTLAGVPFEQSLGQRAEEKKAIGRAAAALCRPGEGIMVDGGTTTFQMCPHLEGLRLQVLTNSLHIVSALLSQEGTRILLPSGSVFREQNIILAPPGEDSMPRFHAPKLFMGAAAIGAQGVMQADVILVAAERRLIDRADQVILLADSTKFASSSGNVVCELSEVDILITDRGISDRDVNTIENAGVRLVIAPNS